MTPVIVSGIIGVVGALLGAIMAFIFQTITEDRKIKAQINEKILDKRIEAHLALVKVIRFFTSVSYIDRKKTNGVDIPYPVFFYGKKEFETLHDKWCQVNRGLKIWSHPNLHKELNYIDNYWNNLNKSVDKIDDEGLPSLEIGRASCRERV